MRKWPCLIMILALAIFTTTCHDSTVPDKTTEPEKEAETVEELSNDVKDPSNGTDGKVAPVFDAN